MPQSDMTDGARNAVEHALGELAEFPTVSLADQPRAAVGVVADLVGDPHLDAVAEIVALRRALLVLGPDVGTTLSVVRRDELVRSVEREGTKRADAVWAIEQACQARGITVIARDDEGADWQRVAMVAVALVSVIVVALLVVRSGDGETANSAASSPVPTTQSTPVTTAEQDFPTTSGVNTTTSGVTTTTVSQTSQPRVSAQFEQRREGPFLVTRGWTVAEGGSDLIGLAILTPAEGQSAAGLHVELAPPLAVGDREASWSDDPVFKSPALARYNVQIEAGSGQEITFRVPLEPGLVVDSAVMLEWFDDWASRVTEFYGGPAGDFDPLVEPSFSQ